MGVLGKTIGSVVGAGAGMFIGQPALGAQIGGGLGSLASTAVGGNGQQQQKITDPTTGTLGFKYGGEMVPTGNFLEFKGASHENGGINLANGNQVEGGETQEIIDGTPYVFSKRLMVPGKSMSFADYHKQIRGNPKEVKKLASQQERVANRSGNKQNSFRYGGKQKKLALGGIDAIDIPQKVKGGESLYIDEIDSVIPTAGPIIDFNNTSSITANPLSSSNGFDFSKTLPYVGGAINIGRSLLESSGTPDREVVDKSVLNRFDTDFNAIPQLRANTESFKTTIENTGNNPIRKLAAFSQKQKGDTAIYGQKENIETQLQNRKVQFEDRLNRRQEQFNIGTKNQRAAEETRRGDLFATGLQQLATVPQLQQREENAKQMDQAKVEMFSQMLSDPETRDELLRVLQTSLPQLFE